VKEDNVKAVQLTNTSIKKTDVSSNMNTSEDDNVSTVDTIADEGIKY
jgi:hypothetical protein